MVNDKTQNGELSQLFNNFSSIDAIGRQFLQTNVPGMLLKSDPERCFEHEINNMWRDLLANPSAVLVTISEHTYLQPSDTVDTLFLTFNLSNSKPFHPPPFTGNYLIFVEFGLSLAPLILFVVHECFTSLMRILIFMILT